MQPRGRGWVVLGIVCWLAACGGDGATPKDAAVDAGPDATWPPPPESLADPASYDCHAASTPPARVSTLPLGCYGDLACEGLVVVAHRGVGYLAPHNTLSAVRAAIVLGVDMVEVDVRLTADSIPVLMHDADVVATTDGTGDVDTLTLAQVQGLTITAREDLPGDFACERVPTFREMLQLAAGRIDVMVDLKAGAAEAAVVIEAEGMLAQAVMLGSLSELSEARAAVPDLRIMIRPEAHAEIQPLWDAFVPTPHVVHIGPGFDDPPSIDLIHGLGAKVLLNMWGADAEATLLGDLSGYAEAHQAGIDIAQCELAFYALWSVGRGTPP